LARVANEKRTAFTVLIQVELSVVFYQKGQNYVNYFVGCFRFHAGVRFVADETGSEKGNEKETRPTLPTGSWYQTPLNIVVKR